MRRILPFLILSLLIPGWAMSATQKTAFLAAIRLVETGDSPAAVGKLGERGAYQFRRQVWHQHTSSSFSLAHDPSIADEVAHRHFDWLVNACLGAGLQPTPRILAMAWNAGLSRVLSGRAPRASIDYASRVSRLVAERDVRPVPILRPSFLAPVVTLGEPVVHFRGAHSALSFW
jgi:hypothetical protein